MNVYDTIMSSHDELMGNAKGEADTLTRHTLIADESADMTSTEQNRVYYGEKLIKIDAAELLQDNHRYLVTFNTGERRIFDPLTLKGSAYLPLRDGNVLKNFSLFHGVLTWCDGTVDIAPETVYAESILYEP